MGVADAVPTAIQDQQWRHADAGGGTNAGDTFRVTINGILTEHVSAGGEDELQVAAALRAALTTALASFDLTVGGAGDVVQVTADTIRDTFTYDYEYEVTGDVTQSSETTTSPGVSWTSTLMDTIRAADDTWYGFAIQSDLKADILAIAAWAETNKKLFGAQTFNPDVLSGTSDVATDLNALSYNQTFLCWHSRPDAFFAFSWMAKTLAADPDEKTTIWAYKTLAGLTSDRAEVSTTEKQQVLSVEGNLYLEFKGTPVAGMGRVASGQPIDLIVTLNWTEARVAEALAQELINWSNRNEKIPYTDVGITVIQSVIETVMKLGERVGHFTPESTTVTVPALSTVTFADKQARLLRCSFLGELAGAIEKVTVSGALVIAL
jgi:hypothetical protein